MAAEIYDRMFETALRLLKKYGVSSTLRYFSPGGGGKYNPATSKAVVNSQEKIKDQARYALVVDAPANRIGPQYGANLEHNTRIQDFNKWAYIDADGDAPTQNHQLIVGNKTYHIYDVQEYAPGGIALMYLAVLRQ